MPRYPEKARYEIRSYKYEKLSTKYEVVSTND